MQFLDALVEELFRIQGKIDFVMKHLLPVWNVRQQLREIGGPIRFHELQQFQRVLEAVGVGTGASHQVTHKNLAALIRLPHGTPRGGFKHRAVGRRRQVSEQLEERFRDCGVKTEPLDVPFDAHFT